MKHQLRYIFAAIILFGTGTISCRKNWLDAKSNKSLVVPSTLKDFQALLDNSYKMNEAHPDLGDVSADSYYITYSAWENLLTAEKNAYIWARDIFEGQATTHWLSIYQQVFYANIVLDGIGNISRNSNNESAWNNVKGSALFFRADAFFQASQLFCKTYDEATASQDEGIPLPLVSDINKKSVRSSVQETYEQILKDLLVAKDLLPVSPELKTRPSKPAACALLARTYLVMGKYDKALLYADSCLQLFNALMDYNQLDSTAAYPIPFMNDEVIIHGKQLNGGVFTANKFFVDSVLYSYYDNNDLRKKIFFRDNGLGGINFIGSYLGPGNYTGNAFGGIASDEVYLIDAECNARLGNTGKAMDILNALLETRYKSGTFSPITATTPDEALSIVLKEREKELLFRGLRWSDLRRLNKDSRFAVTLKRDINGQTYSLSPNSLLYILPIPPDVISLSGMPQNQR